MGEAFGWRLPAAGLEREAAARVVLLLNHILGAEPLVTQRLKAHAGRGIEVRLRAWQRPLPGRLQLQVTRAGMLEERDDGAYRPDLHIAVDVAAAAQALLRAVPSARDFVEAHGDAALADEVFRLLDALRWDIASDLERFAGPVAAGAIERVADAVARNVRETMRAFATPRPR